MNTECMCSLGRGKDIYMLKSVKILGLSPLVLENIAYRPIKVAAFICICNRDCDAQFWCLRCKIICATIVSVGCQFALCETLIV